MIASSWAGVQTAPPHPDQRAYQPYGAADRLFYCRDREILLEGPAGTGKSRGALEKLHLCACKYAGMRALIVRKTRESCTESVLVTFEEKVLPAGSPLKAGPDRARRQRYSYPNGSEIVVGGLDKASRIMSTEFDLILVTEATECTADDVESLTTRLRNGVLPYQQLIAECNPDRPTHWLNQRAAAGKMTRFYSRHADNPRLWADGGWTAEGQVYVGETLAALSGARRARFLEGRWAQAEGQVYEEWDAAVHIVDPFPIPASWPRYRGVDFGYTNPFVCQWWATDPDGRLYLYRELVATQQLVSDLGPHLVAVTGAERVVWTVADHDAEDRATLHRATLLTRPAYKEVGPGLQAVQARLRRAGDGTPRLFVLRGALMARDPRLTAARKPQGLAEEIEGYVWPTAGDGKPAKEAPVKEDDHSLDTMRYVVAEVDGIFLAPALAPRTTGRYQPAPGNPFTRPVGRG